MAIDSEADVPAATDDDGESAGKLLPPLLPRLRVAARTVVERRNPDARRSTPARRTRRPPLGVMVVEPDPSVALTLCRWLRRLGAVPTHARDLRSARRAAAELASISVLVTALDLEGGLGETLARELRARFPAMGVVFAASQGRSEVSWPEAPSVAVVRRPFGVRDLLREIERVAPEPLRTRRPGSRPR